MTAYTDELRSVSKKISAGWISSQKIENAETLIKNFPPLNCSDFGINSPDN